MGEGKEKNNYYGVDKNSIDKALLAKISKYELVQRTTAFIISICNALFMLVICLMEHMSKTLLLIFSGILCAISLAAIVILIVVFVNQKKLKAEIQTSHPDSETTNQK